MSSSWVLYILLSLLTGNPLLALLVVVALAWLGDRVTFRFLPNPVRIAARWRREHQLRRALMLNPNDRRSRLELADLLLARRPREAVAILRPNLDAGDEDVHTAFVYGAALARSRQREPAERALAFACEANPRFRMGEIHLELARLRLADRDFAGAREALERFIAERPGTVEGRYLLRVALKQLGDAEGAERLRRDAWRDYVALPRYRRREERRWAWRLRPLRATATCAAIAAGLLLFASCMASVVNQCDAPPRTPAAPTAAP